MQQQTISRVAIVILAIVMAMFGIYHFMNPGILAAYVPNYLPGGEIWVYVVGAAFILAAISFITNMKVKLAGYLLAAMLFLFVLTIHFPNFMNSGDAETRQIALVSILKDSAIAAFAMHIAAESGK